MIKLETSWDDGSKLDLRLAELLKKYNLPGTFYIPNNHELSSRELGDLVDMGFEIGGHTMSHPQDLKLLSEMDLFIEIELNKVYLEIMTSLEITKFCYPRGRYNDAVIDVVKQSNYKSARTTQILSTDIEQDPYRIKTTIHACPIRPEYDGRDWLEVGKEYLLKAIEEDSYFHLWGHSNEVNKYNEWNKLEALLKFIRETLDKKYGNKNN